MNKEMVKDPLLESQKTSKYIRFFRIAWIFEMMTVVIASIIHSEEITKLDWRLIPGIMSIAGISMVAYAINDYFDRHADALHPTARLRNPLASGEMTLREARMLILVTAAITLILSALVAPLAILTNALFMFIGLVYVAEPIRLKRRFLLDIISHIFTVISYTYFFTVFYFYKWTVLDWGIYINMMLTSLVIQLSQELFDFDHDKEIEHNTAIVIGKKGTQFVIRLAHALFLINTILAYTVYAKGLMSFWLCGYTLIFGVRMYSIFNSKHYEKVLALFRLLLLLFTILYVIHYCTRAF